jgi:diguanylate cyclase (GGDEF)-like protein
LHDELTDLANRTLFFDRLTHRLSLANRRATYFAVLFVDLDKFKGVIDVASRLRIAMRAGDSAARLGGDEFLVLLDDVDTLQAALAVARRLSEALQEPYDIGSDRLSVGASIGVSVGPAGFETADEMVAAADTAMYDAKGLGQGQCVLYTEGRRGVSEKEC